MLTPLADTHPSIPNEAWTKLNTLPGNAKNGILLINEDESNVFRIARVPTGSGAPGNATDGFPLKAGLPGGMVEFGEDQSQNCDWYGYQSSGDALTTLFVQESQ